MSQHKWFPLRYLRGESNLQLFSFTRSSPFSLLSLQLRETAFERIERCLKRAHLTRLHLFYGLLEMNRWITRKSWNEREWSSKLKLDGKSKEGSCVCSFRASIFPFNFADRRERRRKRREMKKKSKGLYVQLNEKLNDRRLSFQVNFNIFLLPNEKSPFLKFLKFVEDL